MAVFAPEPDGSPDKAPRATAVRSSKTSDAALPVQVAAKNNSSAGVVTKIGERDSLGDIKVDLFASQSWQPPPPKVVIAPPPPPSPPLMPYRFAGRLVQDGKVQFFVSKGDTPIAVKLGDTLDGYVVESISASSIALVYPSLGHRESIAVPPGIPGENPALPATASVPAAPAAPPVPQASVARVHWQGPAQVKLGSNFSVALRVDVDQPISGSPMRVRFDPSILESIAVRPGKRYGVEAGRGFNYRINPDGVIVVGATTQSLASRDPELLVLTFKPKKNSTQAEVSLTSLNLQGSGGRALAHDVLASFRTTVTP